MFPAARKVALTAHVTSSVGWLGSVAAFLALAIAGRTSTDLELVRGAYVSMNLIGGCVIIPLSLAALATGLIMAFGTPWGLFRNHWVVWKLILTVGATFLLILHQLTAVAAAAHKVSGASVPPADLLGIGNQLLMDAGLAIGVLLVIATLSIFKPWGVIRPGQGRTIGLVVVGFLVVVVIIKHLAGGGLAHHGH